jgi:hypothetical protein
MLIRLPPPDPPAASITPPPHQSGRSCVDPPPPKLQSITSTTATSLLFERMRDQRLWACTWHSTCSFQFATAVFLFYLITDRDCVDLPFIDVQTSTPSKDEVVVVRPPDRNSDARGQVLFDAAAVPIRPPLSLPGRHPTRVAAPLHDFDDHDHLDLGYLGIKVLSSACGTHRFLFQSQHTRHHDAAAVGDVNSSDSTFTYSPVSLSVVLPL